MVFAALAAFWSDAVVYESCGAIFKANPSIPAALALVMSSSQSADVLLAVKPIYTSQPYYKPLVDQRLLKNVQKPSLLERGPPCLGLRGQPRKIQNAWRRKRY